STSTARAGSRSTPCPSASPPPSPSPSGPRRSSARLDRGDASTRRGRRSRRGPGLVHHVGNRPRFHVRVERHRPPEIIVRPVELPALQRHQRAVVVDQVIVRRPPPRLRHQLLGPVEPPALHLLVR